MNAYDALDLMSLAVKIGTFGFEQLEELINAVGDPDACEEGTYANANAPHHLEIMKSMRRLGVDVDMEIESLEDWIRVHTREQFVG